MLPIFPLALTCACFWIVALRCRECRAADYWEGYKTFCYAYYSHSTEHESVFRNSKLGSLAALNCLIQCNPLLALLAAPCSHPRFARRLKTTSNVCVHTGQLVWRRHSVPPLPSHQVLRNTCMQLLPLVEMYCRWVLEDECNNLRDLMERFDSEAELETHELGRSLLFMIRDEDMGDEGLPRHDPPDAPTNPFADVRERLAAMDYAIRDLRPQVHMHTHFCF